MIVAGKWSAHNNTKTAELITDWFLSQEGQKAITSGWMHYVRKDFDMIPFDSIPTSQIQSNSMPLNWENVFRQRNEIQNRFEGAVTSK
jgi:ABC-type Fe3+ transport system substrate-binding protein